jgi:hypothetical protein
MSFPSKEEIIKSLVERGATQPCPRCGNNKFTVVEGFFANPIQKDLKNLVLGGESIPTVVTACTKCGYVALHAMGVLGLLGSIDREAKE